MNDHQERKLSDYIKHNRHHDGLGMGDKDLEQWADNLERRIAELERDLARVDAETVEDLCAHDNEIRAEERERFKPIVRLVRILSREDCQLAPDGTHPSWCYSCRAKQRLVELENCRQGG